MDTELIARLKLDAAKLRSHRKRTPFRWVGEPKGWRYESQVGDDLAALINAYEKLALEPPTPTVQALNVISRAPPPLKGLACYGGYRQESDEYVCSGTGCALRWDIHEDKPPCPRA